VSTNSSCLNIFLLCSLLEPCNSFLGGFIDCKNRSDFFSFLDTNEHNSLHREKV
jgi:hypothetical protein